MKIGNVSKMVGVAFVTIGLLLVGCAKPTVAPPSPTAKQTVHVTVGALLDQSGPTASGTVPGINGFLDFFQYVNKQGGSDWSGGKVIIDVNLVDCRYDPAISYPAYDKMAAQGIPIIYTHASFDNVGLKDKAAKDKIVLLTMSSTSAALATPGWVFSYTPAYADNFCGFLDWVKATWKGDKPAKIGSLTWDTPWGKSHLCALDYVKELGMEYVGTEYIPTTPTDVTPQLGRLAKAGADYIYSSCTAPLPTIMKDMYRTNFPGKLVCSSNSPMDDGVVVVGYEVGAGAMHASPVIDTAAEPTAPFTVFAQKVQLDVFGSVRPNTTFYPIGAAGALLTQWLIPRALDACGGPDKLTGQVIYDTLLTMKNVDLMGVTMPVSYTPTERRGSMGEKIYQAQKNGTIKAVSDWIVCPDAVHKYPDCAK